MAHPNPLVGCVIVKSNKVIGEGYHKRYNTPHAEINALASLQISAKSATMYVNLEPCCHQGKTGPCTKEIIASGISRVVIGASDPNPLVNGKGIQSLQHAGIDVTTGILEEECKLLNKQFYKWHLTGIPYITLKIAQSIDGKIAHKRTERMFLTGTHIQTFVHHLRAMHDGILVGRGTVQADNPLLTVRSIRGRNPKRIILDSHLRLSNTYKLFQIEPRHDTIMIASNHSDRARIQFYQSNGYRVLPVPEASAGGISCKRLLKKLGQMDISSLLVEGGQRVFSSFVSQGFCDSLQVIIAPTLLGKGLSAYSTNGTQFLKHFDVLRSKKIGSDVLIEYVPKRQ